MDTILVHAYTWRIRLKLRLVRSVFANGWEYVGGCAPAGGVGSCGPHGGCAPFLDDDVPSVATSRDDGPEHLKSSASTDSSESLPNIRDPKCIPCMDAGMALPAPMFEGTYAPGPC